MEQVKKGAASASRTRSIAFVGLAVAIMAVSAWVTVPLGPVPFTLQMFAITFAIVMLSPKECIAAIVLYLALGAIGLPVFSGMSGGIAKLMGPTAAFCGAISSASPLPWGCSTCCAAAWVQLTRQTPPTSAVSLRS